MGGIISESFAAEDAVQADGMMASFAGFIPLILIFVVFYFLVIRPQQRRAKEHSKMLDNIVVGDEVLLSSGFLAVIVKILPEHVVLNEKGAFVAEIADGVRVKVMRSSIASVLSKSKSASDKVDSSVQGSTVANKN